MSTNRTHLGWIGAFAMLTLSLSGCTKGVNESCSGADFESTCTVTYEKSEGQWSTDLDGERTHSRLVLDGTFSVDSGSGTLVVEAGDRTVEYPISAEEPVEIVDLDVELISKKDGARKSPSWSSGPRPTTSSRASPPNTPTRRAEPSADRHS